MTLDIRCVDHFCGAGGASIGLAAAGVVVTDAANHWRPAVDVYNRNNPDTRVHLADLTATHPSRFPRTEMAWFSPECKTYSIAGPSDAMRAPELFDNTGDTKVARSRVTMYDVIRFTDYHRFDVVMVENVVEVNKKYPVAWWVNEIVKMGYRFKVLSLNSMVCWPTPQSRDRWYVVFWREGNPEPDLDIRPGCWCPTCERTVEGYQWWKRPSDDPLRCGKYGPRAQYLYRCSACHEVALPWVWPALAALDLSLPTIRIGDRASHGLGPLAPATMRRIEVGLETFGPQAMVQAAGHCFERKGYYRTWPAWQPLKAQTATLELGIAVRTTQTGSNPRYDATRSAPTHWPLPTQTGQLEMGMLVVPTRTHAAPRDPREPFVPFTTAHGGGQALVELPWLIDSGGGDGPPWSVAGPGRATTANGSQFLVTLRNNGQTRPVEEAMGTLTADGNHHYLLVRMNGGMEDAAAMAGPVEHPAGTITGRANQAVVTPFLTHYYGNARPGASAVAHPLPTQAGHPHQALVEPEAIDPMECGFRMLEPDEAKRGMAIPDGYSLLGYSKRTQVALAGHAVTPPASAEISGRCVDSLRRAS